MEMRMRSRVVRIVVGVVASVALIVGAIWLLTVLLPTRMPRYAGKPLEFWLEQRKSADAGARQEAERLLNDTVVPQLIDAADHETDAAWRVGLVDALNALPGIDINFHNARMRRMRAIYRLGLVGQGNNAVEAFLLRKLDDPTAGVKLIAAEALFTSKVSAEKLVPTLVTWLAAVSEDDDDETIGIMSLLGRFGPAAKSAVPALTKRLSARGKGVPETALKALQQIAPETVVKVKIR